MASYKKINNKWSVVFDMPADDGKRCQKRLSGYPSRRDAELAYIAFKGEKKVVKPAGKGLPFGQIYDKYKNYKQDRVKESSWLVMDDKFRLHILPHFSDMNVGDITAQDCLDWQDWLKGKGTLSPASINDAYTYLVNFFNYCIDFDFTEKSPLVKIKKLRDPRRRVEMRIWTEQQFRSFIEQENDIEYKTLFYTLYLTGLRIGEALALTWKDLQDNEISVHATLTRRTKNMTENGYKRITDTKQSASDRIVLIPDSLIARLKDLKEYYRAINGFTDENFIFGNFRSLPHESVKRHKDSACKAAKVPQIRLHDFRHSHASYLIAHGMDIVTVARRLGHKNIEMTLNTYAHLMENKQKEMLNTLNMI